MYPEELTKIVGFNTLYFAGSSGSIEKTVSLQIPTLPGYIYGPDKGCINYQSTYLTGLVTDGNYNWSLASGSTNLYRDNRDTVLWNSTGLHTLSLSVSNVCGVSPIRQITTDVILFEPKISVQDSVLTATEGLSYQWFLYGSAISAAQGGKSRSIVGRNEGFYTVAVKSFYGCNVTSPAIFCEGLPVILCPGGNTSLQSNLNASSYQWQRNAGSAFVNISNNANYSGTNTNLLQLTNIPSSWYGYKFRCATSIGTSYTFILQFRNSWTGSVSSAWEDPANWSCGGVPDANTDVVINSGTVILSSNTTIRKLVLNPAATLTVLPGVILTITH